MDFLLNTNLYLHYLRILKYPKSFLSCVCKLLCVYIHWRWQWIPSMRFITHHPIGIEQFYQSIVPLKTWPELLYKTLLVRFIAKTSKRLSFASIPSSVLSYTDSCCKNRPLKVYKSTESQGLQLKDANVIASPH